MKLFRRAVILSHRSLGIVLSLLVIMWFATGITMMYWGGMPRVTPELRLERLDPVDFARVRLTPAEAAERAGLETPGRATLVTLLDRPAYRFGSRGSTLVFADSGDVVDELSLEEAQDVAASFTRTPASQVHHVRTLYEVDQWTLQSPLPLHKFRVDDEAGTEVYVQPQTGDVAMMTTRSSRGWAWVSTIPHWLYFTALRTNQPLWYRLVVWSSVLACVLAVLGLILGVTQFRRNRIPYSGAMRWHYISGVVFGVFTLTFAFSGLVSMEPWEWTNAPGLELPRTVLSGGPVDLSRFTAHPPAEWDQVLANRPAKEVEFTRMLDEPYYIVRRSAVERDEGDRERLHQPYPIRHARIEDDRVLIAADTFTVRRGLFDQATLVERVRAAAPEARIVAAELLPEYDAYYYSRVGQVPLPAVRIKFDDPAETWVYVDPSLSQVVTAINRWGRVERWVYHGLHSLDFPYLYNSRPSWDIVMIVLCLGGLTSSGLGFALGLRRMRRTARSVAIAPHEVEGLSPRT
ncbi:MAG: PepSY domain-containing protein [Vicinamibacterales bacterium]